MAAPVLKAQHLGIQFGGLKAVDDFNMEIGESELVGLIGPNGAGKTTVFNLITGVYKPTEGSFYLCGERMNGKKTHQIVHAGIARTFQNIRLFKKMTVIENVKTAMQGHTTYGMADAIFRTKKYWQQEAEITARAKELLVLTDFSVCEIAHQVGFGDESNFSTRFTAMVGQSPQQYRKSAMKPAEN